MYIFIMYYFMHNFKYFIIYNVCFIISTTYDRYSVEFLNIKYFYFFYTLKYEQFIFGNASQEMFQLYKVR